MKQKKRVKEGLVPADALSLTQMVSVNGGSSGGSGSSCGSNNGIGGTATGTGTSTGNVLHTNNTKNGTTLSPPRILSLVGAIQNPSEKLTSNVVNCNNGNVKNIEANNISELNNSLMKNPLNMENCAKDNKNQQDL